MLAVGFGSSTNVFGFLTRALDLFGISGTVLNVRKHIFERKYRKSSRNFSSIVNKLSLVNWL